MATRYVENAHPVDNQKNPMKNSSTTLQFCAIRWTKMRWPNHCKCWLGCRETFMHSELVWTYQQGVHTREQPGSTWSTTGLGPMTQQPQKGFPAGSQLDMHKDVHCGTTGRGRKLEATQVSFTKRQVSKMCECTYGIQCRRKKGGAGRKRGKSRSCFFYQDSKVFSGASPSCLHFIGQNCVTCSHVTKR